MTFINQPLTNLCRQKSPVSLGNTLQSTATHTHFWLIKQPLTNLTLSAKKPSLSTKERYIHEARV